MLLPGGSDVEKIFPEHSTQCQAVVGSLAVACRGRESEGWSTEVSCWMSAATDGDSGFDFCSINNAAKVDRLREREEVCSPRNLTAPGGHVGGR